MTFWEKVQTVYITSILGLLMLEVLLLLSKWGYYHYSGS